MERKAARGNKGKTQKRLNAPEDFVRDFLVQAQHSLEKHHLTRIVRCLEKLADDDIWWRPNPESNSAGNLALHLAGNVRQWIISGLGGEPDIRNRDQEFQELGPIPKRVLVALLQKTVKSACRTLGKLSSADLRSDYTIQKFHVTGFQAVTHITEHFAYHTGQIIYLTKLRLGEDLDFTRLPDDIRRKTKRPRLSAV